MDKRQPRSFWILKKIKANLEFVKQTLEFNWKSDISNQVDQSSSYSELKDERVEKSKITPAIVACGIKFRSLQQAPKINASEGSLAAGGPAASNYPEFSSLATLNSTGHANLLRSSPICWGFSFTPSGYVRDVLINRFRYHRNSVPNLLDPYNGYSQAAATPLNHSYLNRMLFSFISFDLIFKYQTVITEGNLFFFITLKRIDRGGAFFKQIFQ